MRFPHFKSRKRSGVRSIPEERVLAEASELAQLRLEQCVADLHTRMAAMNQAEDELDEQKLGSADTRQFDAPLGRAEHRW